MDNQQNGGANMPVTLEKARVNVFNIVGFSVLLISTGISWGVLYNSMRNADDKAVEAITTLKAELAIVKDKIPQFEVVGMQIQRLTEISAANEKAIQATNERFSRYVESQSGKIDLILSRIGDLTTEVRVVQSQLKDGTPSRTRFPVMRNR